MYGASIEEASIAILRRRGYKVDQKHKTFKKIENKKSSFWRKKSKLTWEEDTKK